MREDVEALLIAFAHYFVRELSKTAQRQAQVVGGFELEAFAPFNKSSAVAVLVDSTAPCVYDTFF
jgi:hypothetical protein